MSSLEEKFETELKILAQRSIDECGYVPSYFLQMLQELGGVATAKALLAKPRPSEGFAKLAEMQRLDLTVETVVLDPRYKMLFEASDIAKAKRWLGR